MPGIKTTDIYSTFIVSGGIIYRSRASAKRQYVKVTIQYREKLRARAKTTAVLVYINKYCTVSGVDWLKHGCTRKCHHVDMEATTRYAELVMRHGYPISRHIKFTCWRTEKDLWE